MDVEAEAVAGAMKEAGEATVLAGRFEAALAEHAFHGLMHGGGLDAVGDGLDADFLGFGDGGVEGTDEFGRPAANHRAGDVAVVPGLL